MSQIKENIRLLSIFHYVVGGLTALIGCFPMIHLAVGILVVSVEIPPEMAAEMAKPDANRNTLPFSPEVPQKIFGTVFIVIASILIVSFWTIAILIVIAGKRLAAYRSHTFCLVAAGISCLIFPFGTALGVFTILTLIKPEARELFGLPSHDNENQNEISA